MVFNSFLFLGFFLLVLGVDRGLPADRPRKLFLVAMSYLFYAAWKWPYLLLLVGSSLLDWGIGNALVRTESTGRRRAWLAVSVVANLGLLAAFKYGNFLLSSLASALGAAGMEWSPPTLPLELPVGISFYTFQTLSYSIDVYRGSLRPPKSILDYLLYVAFFPQLVAGPIVRASEFLPQCERLPRATGGQIGYGAFLIALGLFQKALLSDTILAPVADEIYGAPARASVAEAWIGTLAFTGQIYFDFAGYSLCAIGAALALGFHLAPNFRAPYAASGFSDFWTRWHVSLSSWLRDYLYIPLGGNRRGAFMTARNLMVTMLLGGLWHGADWRFLLWGAGHGVLLLIERALRQVIPSPTASLRLLGSVVCFLGVSVLWDTFRAKSMADTAQLFLAKLGVGAGVGGGLDDWAVVSVLAVLVATVGVHHATRRLRWPELIGRAPSWALGFVLTLVLMGLAMASGDERAFIYFQF